jgi:phosphocarrier protein HPr
MILRRSHPNDKSIVVTRMITVQNDLGLHARPAAEFVRVANRFRSEITLIKDEQRFSGSSLIDVLRANLDKGASAMLEARGADAQAAVSRLEKLLLEFRERKED